MLLAVFPVALTAPGEPGVSYLAEEGSENGDSEPPAGPDHDFGVPRDEFVVPRDEFVDADEDVDEIYKGVGTIYDLSNQVDVESIPEETPPPEEPREIETICPVCGVTFTMDIELLLTDDVRCPICDELLNGEFISFDAENARQLQGEYVLDEIIVKFVDPSQVPGRERQLQREIARVERIGFVEGLGVYVIKVDDLARNPNAVLNRFKNNRFVEYVEPNYTLAPEILPNDPNTSMQTVVFNMINARPGWDILSGSSAVPIAVVDTGVASHPDLPPPLKGYSAIASLSPYNDKVGHGTGVAGTIGMIGNNGIGGAGINWNASIMTVKVDDANGSLSTANIAKGIIWAADNGARIINLSLGTTSDSITMKNAIDYAYNKGVAIFAASGNSGTASVCYPARYDNVFAVGMVSTSDGTVRAPTSNYGSGMNAVAVGSYYSSSASGSYSHRGGTSFATPQVAALASLIWTINPNLTNNEVYRLIEQGAKPLGGGYNQQTGYGLIDVANTMRLAQATVTPPADTTPPVLTLSGSAAMQINQGTNYVEPGFSAIDDKDGNITSRVTVTGTVNTNVPGVYTLTYAVSDTAGNRSTATRTVTVVFIDRIPPVLTLIGGSSMQIRQGEAFIEPGFTAIDETDGVITPRVVVTGTVNVNVPGTYTLTYRVADAAGNASTATRSVTVILVDTTPPVLTLNGSATMQINQGTTYVEPGFTAIDNIDGDITNRVTVTGTVNINTAGTYTLTYRVADAAGNVSTATRTVTVILVDTTPPILTLLGGQTVQTARGVAFVDPGFTAIDNIDGDITNRVTVTGTVNINTAGTYTLTYRVADMAGNVSTAVRTVQVIIVAAPAFRLTGSSSMQIQQGAAYIEPGYTAVDAYEGVITSRVIVSGIVDVNVPGIYTLTYTVSNSRGVSATATRTVQVLAIVVYVPEPEPALPPETVQETRYPPTITLTGFTAIILEYGQPYIEVGYKAEDFRGNGITSAVRVTSDVDIWVAGLYTITYEVIDPVNASLTARVTRTVTVNPKPPEPPPRNAPTITIIGSNPIILYRDSATPYTEQMARAVDHDGRDISNMVTVSGSVNRTVAGTYTLTYSITSPDTGMTSTTTRDVRILAPEERREARAKYGLVAQGKQGAKVTHTGILSSGDGFMDLQVAFIGSNTVINVRLVDIATGRAVLTDTYSAVGTRQYKIDHGRYELEVEFSIASGNTSYAFALTMPESITSFYDIDEVPLVGMPQIAPIGSNPIILHIGGTPYFEQGARAVDHLGNDISGSVVITGEPDTTTAGEYIITYTVAGALGIPATATRLVRILDPNDDTVFLEPEVPLDPGANSVITHIIRVGETLWGISREYYGTGLRWGDIYNANRDIIGNDPRLILPGRELMIFID